MFSTHLKIKCLFLSQHLFCHLQLLSIWTRIKIFDLVKTYQAEERSFLKILLEEKKMLVTSIFSLFGMFSSLSEIMNLAIFAELSSNKLNVIESRLL